MLRFLQTTFLLRPRADLSFWNFLVRGLGYALVMFLLCRYFVSGLWVANFAVATGVGVGLVLIETLFLMIAGGRDRRLRK